ncbi:MAG: HesA/MoeB/ThiF family protein, partial [Gammaproteobacteria bacterium]|nr:HesA/MoeB/ThiF family protein [Gammaproteobacteria bacterium]
MDDKQLIRYSRHILLPEIDLEGQDKLITASVMIIGMGGLGASVAQTLVAAGVGHLDIWDFDRVELSNLQRQPLYDTSQIGLAKVEAAVARLHDINPEVRVTAHEAEFNYDVAKPHAEKVQVILDCTDNYHSRCDINRLAVFLKTPLIAASAIRFEGQLMTFLNQNGPC